MELGARDNNSLITICKTSATRDYTQEVHDANDGILRWDEKLQRAYLEL